MLNTPRTRRFFCKAIFPAFAASINTQAQTQSPMGEYLTLKSRQTFSAGLDRPLYSVAYSFKEKYAWRVTFEEAPVLSAEDMVDVTAPNMQGLRSFNVRQGPLVFDYDFDAKKQVPLDPRRSLQSAIDAYHKAGYPGRYRLLQEGDYFHIVPMENRNAKGAWEASRNPLDVPVSVQGAGRQPMPILEELVRSMGERSGFRIALGTTPFLRGIQPKIHEEFQDVRAREVLKALLAATGRTHVWTLLFWVGHNTYALSTQWLYQIDEKSSQSQGDRTDR